MSVTADFVVRAPLSDAIIAAMSSLVADSQTAGGSRQPSHSELETQFVRAGVLEGDPNRDGKPVGKAKRVRGVLNWAIEHAPQRGEALVSYLVSLLRGVGGFREGSPNYVGADAIQDLRDAMRSEGFDLAENGELLPIVLDGLTGAQLTEALRSYVRRARRGAPDAALLAGTGKDLVEAVAAHVLVHHYGTYPTTANFPTLLGQAFIALGLAPFADQARTPQDKVDASLYQLACAVNTLRNRTGTGHGRPFVADLSADRARSAVESMGLIAGRMLDVLASNR